MTDEANEIDYCEKELEELKAFLSKARANEDAIRAEQDPDLEQVRADCDDYRQSLK